MHGDRGQMVVRFGPRKDVITMARRECSSLKLEHETAWLGAGRPFMHCALVTALLLVFQAEVQAVNKCVDKGRVSYQDTPCKESMETVGQGLAKKERYETLQRKLDRLAADGSGLVQRQPTPQAVKRPPVPESEYFVPRPRSRADERARQAQISAQLQENTERSNAQSAAALTRTLDETKQACGGNLIDYPAIGMSDETFRNCTIHARFGGVTQIVVSEDGKIPLRLYIFPTQRAQKVYSIDGVITAIKP
jgi:hypothetical protein